MGDGRKEFQCSLQKLFHFFPVTLSPTNPRNPYQSASKSSWSLRVSNADGGEINLLTRIETDFAERRGDGVTRSNC